MPRWRIRFRRSSGPASTFVVILFAVALLPGFAAADHVVIPLAFEETHGELGGATILVPNGVTTTHQTQIAASQLAPLGVGDRLTGLTFRLFPHMANPDLWPPADVTWVDYDITIAQAALPLASFGTNFAANMLDPQLVRSGPLTVPQGSFPDDPTLPPAAPNEWGYELVFDQSYRYRGGDLVIHIAFRGGSDGPLGYMDALFASPQNSAMLRSIQADTFAAATGNLTRPIIMRLTVSPLLGDLDGDGDVDLPDLTLLLSGYGCTGGSCLADIDGDGQVGLSDLTILLANFGM